MKAVDARLAGWKWKGHGENQPAALSFFLIALLGTLLPVSSHSGRALRKLTLIAVAASLAFVHLPAALATGGPESVHYASLAEREASDHGHSHDDEAVDHSAAHQHSHDPADHSHHHIFLTGGSSQWGLPPAERWPAALSSRPNAAIGLGIERPPKRVMFL